MLRRISLLAGLMLGLAGLGSAVAAQEGEEGLSYSPEHWPSRWSSAVRQQQGSVFPNRSKEQALDNGDNFVTESDLFARPGRSRQWDELGDTDGWDRMTAFEDGKFRDRRERNRQRGSTPYPYHYPGYYSDGYNTMYPAPYSAAGPMSWDPVLGYGGLGYPPVGMPIINYPFIGFPLVGNAWPAYYGAPGGFNYPFGPW